MKVNSHNKFITILDSKPDMFDRKVNNIISKSQEAELIFTNTRPLMVHIIYTEQPAKEGR